MYEHLRNDFMLKLSNHFNSTQLNIITGILDDIANNYNISTKSTELVVYENIFPKVAEVYLQSKLLEGISPNSEKFYRNRLRIFFETLQMKPEQVSTNDIRCFLATYKKQTGVTDRTLDKFRQIINGFFAWCVDEEYLDKNPCKNIKQIKFEVTPRKSLTRMELEMIRRACKTKRDLAIVDTLYSTGCRVSELINMKISDINREDKSIHIIGKGKKHNTCYLNTNAQLSLNEYMKERKDDSTYLFVGKREPFNKLSIKAIELIFKDISKNTGIMVTPHIMRHTCATLSLQSGMPLHQVQRMLGHASSDTTLIYAETSQEDVKHSHLKYVV